MTGLFSFPLPCSDTPFLPPDTSDAPPDPAHPARHPLLAILCSGCAVVAVADAAITVVATTVKVGAAVVETTVDVAAAGVKAATGSDEEKK